MRVVQRKRWGEVVLPLGNHVGDPKAQIGEAHECSEPESVRIN